MKSLSGWNALKLKAPTANAPIVLKAQIASQQICLVSFTFELGFLSAKLYRIVWQLLFEFHALRFSSHSTRIQLWNETRLQCCKLPITVKLHENGFSTDMEKVWVTRRNVLLISTLYWNRLNSETVQEKEAQTIRSLKRRRIQNNFFFFFLSSSLHVNCFPILLLFFSRALLSPSHQQQNERKNRKKKFSFGVTIKYKKVKEILETRERQQEGEIL